MHTGQALLALASREAELPILADPLPQPFSPLVVVGQLGARIHDRLTEGAPFTIGDLDSRLAREGLIGQRAKGGICESPENPLGADGPSVDSVDSAHPVISNAIARNSNLRVAAPRRRAPSSTGFRFILGA
jgi:hypothetical protein